MNCQLADGGLAFLLKRRERHTAPGRAFVRRGVHRAPLGHFLAVLLYGSIPVRHLAVVVGPAGVESIGSLPRICHAVTVRVFPSRRARQSHEQVGRVLGLPAYIYLGDDDSPGDGGSQAETVAAQEAAQEASQEISREADQETASEEGA